MSKEIAIIVPKSAWKVVYSYSSKDSLKDKK